MNMILLFPDDFTSSNTVLLKGRRLQHMLEVQKVEIGKSLDVGLVNGNKGKGVITELGHDKAELEVQLNIAPPGALPLTVLLALPRPKMLKRCLQTLSTMGVKDIILINSYRVEKSFWQTPLLKEEQIKEQLILGLEQAEDTLLPRVTLEKRFKPFVEDRLPELVKNKAAFVAHPVGGSRCPQNINKPAVLAIGPEGGFIEYEVNKLQQAGFQSIHLGERILRVETAIPVLISKLYEM